MQSRSDLQLLREYVQRGHEAAFAEILARHTNLVFSAALRQLNSPDMAAEITQNVFIGLARGAQSLSARFAENASLAGWLCRSARNLSLNFRRDEFRRHSRERLVMEDVGSNPETSADWERLRPVLDDAMFALDESDYDALVMRFFQNQDLRSVGLALGVSDDTAQKRVSRALDKLREHLSRHGITASAAALSLVLSANAVQAAPASLTATISAAALSGTTLAVTATAAVSKTIAMTTLQKTLIAIALAASVVTPLAIQHQAQIKLRDENQSLRQQAEQFTALAAETTRLSNLLAQTKSAQTGSSGSMDELLKLRGEVGMLHQQTNELGRLLAENNRLRAAQSETANNRLRAAQSEMAASACIPKLKQIEGAGEQWALEQKKPATATVSLTDISGNARAFIKAAINKELTCPAGGTYAVTEIGRASCR